MKFVDTTLLRIGYEEHNPTGQKTCVLLHGWPDSIRTWNGVAPVLAQAGWRVLVPALRGFAPTTFLRADTPRTGQLAAIGRDLIEFIDALQLNAPALVGHDWGARAVANACGLRPGIASHMVMLSVGYGTNDPKQAINHCKIDIVTKENVEEFTGLWEKWLGEKKPAATDKKEEKPAEKK